MSPKPFAWTAKLKASEEASGITGWASSYLITKKNKTIVSYENGVFDIIIIISTVLDDDGPLLAIGLCYSLLSRSRDVPTDTPSSTYVIFIANNFFILTSKLTFIIFIDKDYLIWNSFVRCLDTTTSSTLDTSPRARFHQTCLYWQHPHLPWLDLFPRSSGRVSATSFMATNEEVKEALLTEWKESFRSLFQVSCNRVIYLAFQSTSLFPLSFVLV